MDEGHSPLLTTWVFVDADARAKSRGVSSEVGRSTVCADWEPGLEAAGADNCRAPGELVGFKAVSPAGTLPGRWANWDFHCSSCWRSSAFSRLSRSSFSNSRCICWLTAA